MDKKTVYRYKGTDYPNIAALRYAMKNVSLPDSLTDEQCEEIGVLKLQLNYSETEAKALQVERLYNKYQSALLADTHYSIDGKNYLIERNTENIIKFNAAHEVAKIKGYNFFRLKTETGGHELVALKVSDFESILMESALQQQAAYNNFLKKRAEVRKTKAVSKILSIDF